MSVDGPNRELLDLFKQVKAAISSFKPKSKWAVRHALELCGDIIEVAMDTEYREFAEGMEQLRKMLQETRDRKTQTKTRKKLLTEHLARLKGLLGDEEELPEDEESAEDIEPAQEQGSKSQEQQPEESTEVDGDSGSREEASDPSQPQTLEDILRAAFIEESAAAFPELRASLAAFQASDDPEERAKAIEPAFRAAHSIKGAARAIELHEAEMVAASLEKSLRSASTPQKSFLDEKSLDYVNQAVDLLAEVSDSFRDKTEPPSFDRLREVVDQLDKVKGAAPPVAESAAVAGEETEDLDSLLQEGFQSEADEQLPLIKEGLALFPIDSVDIGKAVVDSLCGSLEALAEAARGADFGKIEPLLAALSTYFRECATQQDYSLSGGGLKTIKKAFGLLEKSALAFAQGKSGPTSSQIDKMLSALELLQKSQSKKGSEPEPPRQEPVPPVSEEGADQEALLKEAFLEEAGAFKTAYFKGIKDYRMASNPQERVEVLKPVFRAVHGLRGAARAVDLTEAEILCSSLEQVLRLATQPHRSYLSAGDLGALEAAGETLTAAVDAFRDDSRGPTRNRIRQVLDALELVDPGAPEQSIEMVVNFDEDLDASDPESNLQALFREEAEDYLLSLNKLLVEFERHRDDEAKSMDILERVFRDVHSLKGASRSVGLEKVEAVCQGLETVYSRLKRGDIALTQAAVDVSFRSVDVVTQLLDGISVSEDELDDLQIALQMVAQGEGDPGVPRPRTVSPAPPKKSTMPAPVAAIPAAPERETVRLQVNKLDGLLLQAEEMLTIKLKATQRANETRVLGEELAGFERQWKKVAPALAKLKTADQEATAVLDFVNWSQRYIRQLESQVKALHRSSVQDERMTRGLVDNILEDAKQLLLFPFSSLLERFPRLIRDLGRDLNKEVDFQVSGQQIEIDRRILDELRDPLTHLVRNAIDHGLESAAERKRANKSSRGRLEINVSRETAEHILVEIRDDGRGIDSEKLRKKAVERGVYSKSEVSKMSDQQVQEFIFLSDFSTADKVTEVSGRGLGMPIVAEKIDALGGNVTVRSEVGEGTRFLLRLPIRRATYNGILVSAGGETVVIPTTSVMSVHRFDFEKDVKTIEGQATVEVRGRVVPIVRLEEVLAFRNADVVSTSQFLLAVMLEYQGNRAAFIVDELIAEQEILAKKPSFPLNKIPTLAGSTILGNGRVAPILNVAALIEPLVKSTLRSTKEEVAPARPKADNYKILLCDDSITSRTLLTHILSNAGYNVTAKIDGAQAYEALLDGDYDLLCSDVEMPNMTGLELCAKVRETPGFEDLPIVLITTLDDPEDHQRGADAGASAYVVKGRLDQDQLLETVEFLL